MEHQFQARTFNIKTFYRYLEDAIKDFGRLRTAVKSNRVSAGFRERIMLAVTRVNGCRYCSYFHASLALKSGMAEEDIQQLLNGGLGHIAPEESVALLFAELYADLGARPDPEAWQRLVDTYGPETAWDILAYIRAIMVGNVYGISFDALQRRFSGQADPNNTIWQELGIAFGVVVFVPLVAIKRLFVGNTRFSDGHFGRASL
jgi:AhpD family alkylhydroperoxidase